MKKAPLLAILGLLFPLLLQAQLNLTIHPRPARGEFRGVQYRIPRASNRPKIGLVLSGGGARGLAQIGVLKTLEEHHIPIDLIVGNSLGSVVGGLYASGYTTTELESIAVHNNWDELLSFSEEANRSDLFVEQKQANLEGFLAVRLDGLQPIIPSSISGGQHLTNFFMNLTLQALFHPDSTFDELKIPFRSVATDLYHGKRVVLDRGSLAEAMRASVTVPFLYTPLERDSMALVDGGLLSNIPVDVARSLGCDIVIVVNSTSTIRQEGHFSAPWEVADQIMTIMMQSANEVQLQDADLVITPPLGNHTVSDFTGIDSIIGIGKETAEAQMDTLAHLINERSIPVTSQYGNRVFADASLRFTGDSLPRAIRESINYRIMHHSLGVRDIEESISQVYATGEASDASCEIREMADGPAAIIYNTRSNPLIHDVRVTGVHSLHTSEVDSQFMDLRGTILNNQTLAEALENLLRLYRKNMYSLARIDSVRIDSSSGAITVAVNEGVLADIKFEGNEKTKDYVIRRELPYEANTVFNLRKAYQGLVDVASTGLFDYVLLNIRYNRQQPVAVIKVKEKPSETLLLGIHGDNEHGLVSTINLSDENFRGAGDELSMLLRYGLRDRQARIGYRANRIFQTYFTFNLKTYIFSRDLFTYMDDPQGSQLHWARTEQGRYRENRVGGSFSFGSQVERLGSVTADIRAEHQSIDSLSGTGFAPESQNLVALRLQTTLDTEDKFIFPTEGVFFNGYYEWASRRIGSEVSFSKIGFVYEAFHTLGGRHTIHPRVTFGFADQTLPVTEQYRLGGFNSFLGLPEDDSRGRQIFLVNAEYRYFAPFRLLFDTYLGLRYDLGTISAVPEDLKFSTFRHGFGAILSLDTPLGMASVGAGISFFFQQSMPENPVSNGPLTFYFSIGPAIY